VHAWSVIVEPQRLNGRMVRVPLVKVSRNGSKNHLLRHHVRAVHWRYDALVLGLEVCLDGPIMIFGGGILAAMGAYTLAEDFAEAFPRPKG
jgi:hypothetical protein